MQTVTGDGGTEWSYESSDRIGDPGGFGEVFRGRGSDGAAVAIKRVRLRPGAGSERLREREVEIGRQIAQAGTAVSHLVAPLDVAHAGDDLLIVMPLAETSLAAALRDAELDMTARLAAVEEVAEGLMELAGLGLLHRDLKPGNVLRIDGRWKLADFGMARNLLESTATYTFRGGGTMPYMAPELWNNQSATVKTDLYAFGVLAYEVLDGGRPFRGPHEDDYRQQHLQLAPPTPGTGVPALDRMLLRLVAKDPGQRPQDARDVRDRIQNAAQVLTAVQQELQQAAVTAQIRTSAAEAERQQEWEEWRRRATQTQQAIAELDEILADALDQARHALPETDLIRPAARRVTATRWWRLSFRDAHLDIALWHDVDQHLGGDDPYVVGGTATISMPGGWVAANLVCEQVGDRVEWFALEFRSNALGMPTYELGPADRAHGFLQPGFIAERPHMVHRAVHIWSMTKTGLTPDYLLGLLRAAIDLI